MSSLRPLFVATPTSFSFGAIRDEARAGGLGDDVASPVVNMLSFRMVLKLQRNLRLMKREIIGIFTVLSRFKTVVKIAPWSLTLLILNLRC